MGGIPPIFFISIFFTLNAIAAPPSPPTTWQQTKFKKTIRQSEDFSCGAASLSTLLTYDFEKPTSEAEILDKLKNKIPESEWEKSKNFGFSLYDLKLAAEQSGFLSEGFRINFKTLTSAKQAVIVHLKKGDYEHFVVFRGYINGQIILADPNNGEIRQPPSIFLNEWTGYTLAILKNIDKKENLTNNGNSPQNSKIQSIRNAITFEHPYWQGLR